MNDRADSGVPVALCELKVAALDGMIKLDPSTAGKIILLNGASSSGKSTLAAALQAALEVPFWHYSIDHLLAANMFPRDRVSGKFSWPELRPRFFEGFHNTLPALAAAGNNLIVEHIVETREWMNRLKALLSAHDVFFIGVHCPLEELERRELARGDRRIGESKADYETTHRHCTYDLEVSSTDSISDSVRKIISAWKSRSRPSAFERSAVGKDAS
jgi:chloramphenicol 3-O phosphotransferase